MATGPPGGPLVSTLPPTVTVAQQPLTASVAPSTLSGALPPSGLPGSMSQHVLTNLVPSPSPLGLPHLSHEQLGQLAIASFGGGKKRPRDPGEDLVLVLFSRPLVLSHPSPRRERSELLNFAACEIFLVGYSLLVRTATGKICSIM